MSHNTTKVGILQSGVLTPLGTDFGIGSDDTLYYFHLLNSGEMKGKDTKPGLSDYKSRHNCETERRAAG